VEGADAEKAKREAAVLETAAALTASSEDTKAKAAAKDELVKASKASMEALKAAKAAQTSGDADAVAIEKAKANLEGAGLAAMKEGALTKKQQTAIAKELTTAGVEQSLISCLHLPASKKPEKRESFDNVVLQHLEQAYEAKIAELNSKLAEAGPAREERAAAVTSAAAADEAAKASAEAAGEALKLAKDAESAAKAAAAEAKTSAGSLESEVTAAAKSLEKAKAALASFQEGPKASFKELVERTAPAPAPEA